MTIDKVAVLGGGLMGSGIAESVAAAGVPTVVREIDDDAVGEALGRVESSLDHAVARGKLDRSGRDEILGRIEFTTDLDRAADAALVIEAVPEDAGLKCAVLADVAKRISAETIIASNTSSIPIAQLAASVPRPERMVGLHFFSPVPVMKLVEIVVALDTGEAAVAAAREFAHRIGKVPIETKDRSGFIVNALLVPYLMSAVRMYEDGFATREAIDEGMRLGCGHPMGPLTLCDFIGLDVLYNVTNSLYEEFRTPEYAPPPLLRRMVASGRLGKKSGRGFYEYAGGRSKVAV